MIPAWKRPTPAEHRWPVTLSVVAAIVLQILLPTRLDAPLPRDLLPGVEALVLLATIIVNPVRFERGEVFARFASVALIAVMTFANSVSAVLLIRAILQSRAGTSATPLLADAASIWATNVIAYALWYWELDRGGPAQRALGARQRPDLMFPQMASPDLAPPDWEPFFADYLYLSFTNATAFSPTDVMPLSRWAKLTMMMQAGVSLAVGALVIARAVNILR